MKRPLSVVAITSEWRQHSRPGSKYGRDVLKGDLFMNLSTKLSASLSAAALGSAVVLGGAGIANAQSSGSLGSSGPDAVVLTVAGDGEEVGGTIANNTSESLNCSIVVSDSRVISAVEDDFGGETSLAEAFAENNDALQEANGEGKNAIWGIPVPIAVPANSEVDWTGAGYSPTADYRAGAAADCGGDNVAFAYEPGGLFGSLDMGSLGS